MKGTSVELKAEKKGHAGGRPLVPALSVSSKCVFSVIPLLPGGTGSGKNTSSMALPALGLVVASYHLCCPLGFSNSFMTNSPRHRL